MPNIENLARKSFKNNRGPLLNVYRDEILNREDIKVSFGYVVVGLAASLALAGGVYVIGKQLLK